MKENSLKNVKWSSTVVVFLIVSLILICYIIVQADTDNNSETNAAFLAKEKVMEYLYESQGKQTVIGIHNREPNYDPAKQTNRITAVTGVTPALWSGDFLFSSSDVDNRWNMIYECKRQWDNGAIVNLLLHVTPPTQAEKGYWDGGVISELSDEQWNSLITDGSELNKSWKERLDNYAEYLQYLEDNGVPVMFRPFHEMNQSKFWWGGRPGRDGTAALYRLTKDYLENEKGLENLIWVWDMQDLSYNWEDYDPGEDYWDIFAVDVYNTDYFTTYKYNKALEIAGDKLIAIGECDKLPSPEELVNQPKWSFVMSWAELTFLHNTDEEIKNLYMAENAVVLKELPDFKYTVQPTENTTVEPTPEIMATLTPTDTPEQIVTSDPTVTVEPTNTPDATPAVTFTPSVTVPPTEEPIITISPEPLVTIAPIETPVQTYLPGDVDGNAMVNAEDALDVLKHAAKLEQLTDEKLVRADVSGNGKIDAEDALVILKLAAKVCI